MKVDNISGRMPNAGKLISSRVVLLNARCMCTTSAVVHCCRYLMFVVVEKHAIRSLQRFVSTN